MRIIGGELRGRRLASFKGVKIRPTSDKVREAVFNILPKDFGERFKQVLDLFAGTGAMGIEALSRGAKEATFVDSDVLAASLIEKNIMLCRPGAAFFVKRDSLDAIRHLSGKGKVFDLIFIDPPYEAGLAEKVLREIDERGILSPNGVVVAEASKRRPIDKTDLRLECVDERRYGDTVVCFFERP